MAIEQDKQEKLRKRATEQIQIACNMIAGAVRFSQAVAASSQRAPKRPVWERHAEADALHHIQVQARLREILGSRHDR